MIVACGCWLYIIILLLIQKWPVVQALARVESRSVHCSATWDTWHTFGVAQHGIKHAWTNQQGLGNSCFFGLWVLWVALESFRLAHLCASLVRCFICHECFSRCQTAIWSGFYTIRPNDFPGGPQSYDERPSRDSLRENCWIPRPNSMGSSYLGPWWTMSHKPARTAPHFISVRETWRLVCFRTIGKKNSATSKCLHERCHQLNPVNSDQEPLSSLFKFSVTAISWTRFRFQMINKTQLEFFYQKSTPKCTFFGNFLRHQLQHQPATSSSVRGFPGFLQPEDLQNGRLVRGFNWNPALASVGFHMFPYDYFLTVRSIPGQLDQRLR